ncbi:MAG: M81 family metallopeptidase, partial [Anaerolineae bacterium]|nr:M81 family metallopeptidase [Anaerolineae bacterium]
MRIAIGGFAHETNTFSPFHTDYGDFYFSRGAELLSDCPVEPWQGEVELVPTFVAHAMPGGLVRRAAYLRIKEALLGELQAALPVDGVYLALHGAMEVEGIGDGEGDLVAAVRSLLGERVLICASLDLHGNISPALAANANILTALR